MALLSRKGGLQSIAPNAQLRGTDPDEVVSWVGTVPCPSVGLAAIVALASLRGSKGH